MSWHIGHRTYDDIDPISKETLYIRGIGLDQATTSAYRFDNGKSKLKGYRFHYTLEGYGMYKTPYSCQKIKAGHAFIVDYPEHSSYYFPAECEGIMTWTYFYLDFLGPACKPIMERILKINGPILSLPIDSMPIVHFFELYNLLYIEGDLEPYYGSEWLYSFLISLLRIAEKTDAKQISSNISDSVLWMKNNIGNQINLQEMSQSLGITYAHFSRQFAKELGLPPLQYLTQLRIRHATHMLLYSDASITQIAYECGFSSANYFTKVFKSTMMTTPSDYRRLNATPKAKSGFKTKSVHSNKCLRHINSPAPHL